MIPESEEQFIQRIVSSQEAFTKNFNESVNNGYSLVVESGEGQTVINFTEQSLSFDQVFGPSAASVVASPKKITMGG